MKPLVCRTFSEQLKVIVVQYYEEMVALGCIIILIEREVLWVSI